MALNQLSKFAADGNTLGQAPSDKISFHGATPIAQQVLATGATTVQIIAALTALGLVRNT